MPRYFFGSAGVIKSRNASNTVLNFSLGLTFSRWSLRVTELAESSRKRRVATSRKFAFTFFESSHMQKKF
jgi:hypothetical protein